MKKKIVSILIVVAISLGAISNVSATSNPATASTSETTASAVNPAADAAGAIASAYVAATSTPATFATGLTAAPTSSSILVNGDITAFDAYNINGNNYFKLRDLAYALNGTGKQFEVGWDGANNAISLTKGRRYTEVGGEMASKGPGNKRPAPTSSRIFLDGSEVRLAAYNIGGNNYFRLRDVGFIINFGVDWDGASNAIAIDTGKGYTPDDGTLTPASVFDVAAPVPHTRLLQYYSLTKEERALYDRLAAGIMNFDLAVEVGSGLKNDADVAKLNRICMLVYYTLPEVFWWNGGVRFVMDGSPADDGKYYIFPVYVTNGERLYADISGYNTLAYPPAAQIIAAKNWVGRGKAAIRETLRGLPLHLGMTPYEMELAVYDWIADNVENDGSDYSKHEFNTTYGALVERRVDCTGFSRTLQYVMCQLGVESLVVEGVDPMGDNHLWGAIKLDGEWYYIDVTRDAVMHAQDDFPWRYFLNRTDEAMEQQGYTTGIPGYADVNPNISCNATKYNYYLMAGSHIASDDDFVNKVPVCIAAARANGDKAFAFEFAPSYAEPNVIHEKLRLIDSDLFKGIQFYHNAVGLVFGVF